MINVDTGLVNALLGYFDVELKTFLPLVSSDSVKVHI